MKKLAKGALSIIAIIALIFLIILFKGVSDIEKYEARSHSLSDAISAENIESIIFQDGKDNDEGLYKRYTISDQDFIDKMEFVINTAVINGQIDKLSIQKSNYAEKYMTICYDDGTKTKVTFYGTGDSILGVNGKYYKIVYKPQGNDFISYFRDNYFSYDLVNDKGDVSKHIEGKNPLDIDLKEIQKIYKENWDNTPSILDPNGSITPQDIYSYYWDKTPTILD